MAFIPLNKPSEDLVLRLINLSNPPPAGRSAITHDDVFFQDLRVGEIPERNTTLTVVAKPDFDHQYQQVVHYDRLDISRFSINGERQMDGYYYSTDQLIPELNANFGFGLVPEEIVSAEIGDDNYIVLKISNSLAYLPDTEMRIREGYFDLVERMEDIFLGSFSQLGEVSIPTFGA